MTREQRDALRALALKATPGPWAVCAGQLVWGVTKDSPGLTCSGCGGVATPKHDLIAEPLTHRHRADATYIAACDPATVLALLDAHDALRSAAEAARDALEQVCQSGREVCDMAPLFVQARDIQSLANYGTNIASLSGAGLAALERALEPEGA